MLAVKDRKHVVRASIPGLASVANIPVESVKRGLAKLASPDEFSRTKEHEGRRITEVDGGWLILNGEKYRNYLSKAERNEYQKNLMAERRKTKKLAGVSKSLAVLAQAEAEADTDTEAKAEARGARSGAPADFVPSLKAMECYKPLDIDSELQRAQMWCTRNRRKCTERFFLNWLNRALDNHRTVAPAPSNGIRENIKPKVIHSDDL